MQNLMTRSAFAKLAGVNPSTVTRVAGTLLKGAVVGKRIDANHPDAQAYLQVQEALGQPPPAVGLDPLHDEAVALCTKTGRWTANTLKLGLKIGSDRAKRIITVIIASGLAPTPEEPQPEPEPVAEAYKPKARSNPKPRGRAAIPREVREEIEDRIDAAGHTGEPEIPEELSAVADWTVRDVVRRFGTDARFVDWLKATKEIEMVEEKRLKNATTRGQLVSRVLVRNGLLDTVEAAFARLLTDASKTIAARGRAIIEAGGSEVDLEDMVTEQIAGVIKPTKAKMQRVFKSV